MNEKEREQLFIKLANEVKNNSKFKSLDFSEKLQVIRSIKTVCERLDDNKLSVLSGDLFIDTINERGFNRTKKLKKFADKLGHVETFENDEKRVEFKKRYKEMLFGTITGIDLD